MVHYVYKITNLINGMFYIGKHSTEYVDDGYMGSGTLVKRAIAKHGVENFKKEILQFFDSAEQALEYERSIVTQDLVERKDSYNMTIGGNGSWYSINSNEDLRKEKNSKAARIMNSKTWNDQKFVERVKRRSSETFRRLHEEGKIKPHDWSGRKHSDKTRENMRKSHVGKHEGEKNSQFNTCWIYSLEEKSSKKISRDELDLWLQKGWLLGRKMKS